MPRFVISNFGRVRPLLLALGAAIYIGGFLALVYVVGIAEPSLELWAPFQAPVAASSPSPLPAPSVKPAAAARTSALPSTAKLHTVGSKAPGTQVSPCPKIARAAGPPKRTPPVPKPGASLLPPVVRPTAAPARIAHAIEAVHSVVARPHPRHPAARPAAHAEQEGSAVLVPVGKSAAASGIANELDPRAAAHGDLIINPSAAATPPSAPAGPQSK